MYGPVRRERDLTEKRGKNQFSPPDVKDKYIWNIEMRFDYHLCDERHRASLTAVTTYCWSTFISLWQIRTKVTWALCMKAANGKWMRWFWQMSEWNQWIECPSRCAQVKAIVGRCQMDTRLQLKWLVGIMTTIIYPINHSFQAQDERKNNWRSWAKYWSLLEI